MNCYLIDYYGCGSLYGVDTHLVDYGDMTVTFCREYCRGLGYNWAATTAAVNCSCLSSSLSNYSYVSSDVRECNTSCAGHVRQMCGGAERYSIYFVGRQELYILNQIEFGMIGLINQSLN